MWKLKRKAALYESRTLWNLILPLKYLFKGKFMNVFRFMTHNHVWVSKRPTEVQNKSVRSEASGDFVNSCGWNRRLYVFLREQPESSAFGEEQVLQHLCSLRRRGHPFRAPHGCWVSQRRCSWFHEYLRNKELLLCRLLPTSKSRPFTVSHCSLCWGCCGTQCGKWGGAGAAVIPLLAPSKVSWA